MAAFFQVGSFVWVKMPDYPWWPGVVVDAEALQADTSLRLPEQDLCVQCLPTAAPSVMFVSSSNESEVRPYAGADADKQLIAEGQAHPECAPAVEEALTLFEAAADAAKLAELAKEHGNMDETLDLLMQMDDEPAAAGSSDSSEDDGEAEEKALLNLSSVAPGDGTEGAAHREGAATVSKEERRRQRKLQKKLEKAQRKLAEKERNKKDKSKPKKKARHDSDSDSEDDSGRRMKKTKKTDPRDLRQTRLDAYSAEAARPPAMSHFTESDADYYRRKLEKRRQTVSDAMLTQCVAKLREVTGECMENDNYEQQEDALLELLRPLSAYNVSYEQLRSTGVGAVVGALLKETFPTRVRALANGILGYWFRTLPNQIQTELSADSEIDRCSIETTAGTRSDGMEEALGAVGLHLYESFTEEEIYDAPPGTNVVEICKNIETLLRENSDDLDTRVMVLTTIGDAHNTALRRGILDGKFTPHDILVHANDLNGLLRNVNKRGLRFIDTSFTSQGSPTTPYAPFSPTGFGRSPDGGSGTGSPGFSPTGGGMGTFTTMYTCPQCGAAEAYRTEYTVQAHDNFPEILRCRKCGTTWNAAE